MKFLPYIFSMLLMISMQPSASAQGDPGGDPDIPIDGGVILMIAAATGYGIRKIYDTRKQKNSE
ncbi:MAG TPA: hypothetical protein VF145_12085 [Chitinophagaceae bacterium]